MSQTTKQVVLTEISNTLNKRPPPRFSPKIVPYNSLTLASPNASTASEATDPSCFRVWWWRLSHWCRETFGNCFFPNNTEDDQLLHEGPSHSNSAAIYVSLSRFPLFYFESSLTVIYRIRKILGLTIIPLQTSDAVFISSQSKNK